MRKPDIEEVQREFSRSLEAATTAAMMGGPPRKQRQTALRLHGRSFETVELDDAGNVIEPVRCTCGPWSIIHRSGCPFVYIST